MNFGTLMMILNSEIKNSAEKELSEYWPLELWDSAEKELSEYWTLELVLRSFGSYKRCKMDTFQNRRFDHRAAATDRHRI